MRTKSDILKLISYACLVLSPLPEVSYAQETVPVAVNWRADRKACSANTFQLNTWDAANPLVATSTSYLNALDSFKLGMVRMHAYEIYSTTNTDKQWVDYTTKTWRSAKIVQVLGGLRSKVTDVMLNIPNWPSWMDQDADGRLDDGTTTGTTDQRQAYASWCAALVKITNVDNNLGIRYWEVLNEKEGSYGWGDAVYSDIYNRCATAMKLVDPSIQVGGCAITQPWPTTTQETALKSWIAAVKPNLGFFSYHHYGTSGYNPSSDVIHDRALSIGTRAAWARGILNSQGIASTVPIFVGETNIFSSWTYDQSTMYMRGMLGAEYLALVVKSVGESPDASAVQFWNDRDGTYGLMKNDSSFGFRPAAYVLSLANAHFIGTSVGVSSADANKINAFSVKSSNGTKKSVMLVNTSDTAFTDGTTGSGTDYVAALSFSDSWIPATGSYTCYSVTANSDTGVLTSTAGSYTGGVLNLSLPAKCIKVLVFTDAQNDPNRLVRNPEADTYVAENYPSINYGSGTRLNTYGKAGYNAEALMRFDLSDLGGAILSAKLRLYPRQVGGSATHRLDQVPGNSWAELGTTWTNRPAATSNFLATWTPLANGMNELDITSLAQVAASGTEKKLSLRITSSAGIDIRYGSREELAENRPELIIQRNPAPLTIEASADAYVNEAAPAANYATATQLYTKRTGSGGDTETYLQFNLSGVPSVGSAKLYLWAYAVDSYNRANWVGLSQSSWSETTLTWNNRPGSTTDIGGSFVPVSNQDTILDVTNEVAASVASGKISFRIYSKISGGLNRYGSREQADPNNRPVLVISP